MKLLSQMDGIGAGIIVLLIFAFVFTVVAYVIVYFIFLLIAKKLTGKANPSELTYAGAHVTAGAAALVTLVGTFFLF